MNVPSFVVCALAIYAVTVIILETSFISKFVWPVARFAVDVMTRLEAWLTPFKYEPTSWSYLRWKETAIHSQGWLTSGLATLLSCRVCLSFWIATAVLLLEMDTITPHHITYILAWMALTHLLSGKK